MFLRFVPVIACAVAFSGCKRHTVIDPADLQTPAAEAALRYVIDHSPRRKDAKLAIICIGDAPMSPATEEFEARFKDIPGLEFINFLRMEHGMYNGKPRRWDFQTKKFVLEVQISALTPFKDGRAEAIAAWAYEDDAERYRLRILEKAGGGYDVKELETIPVSNRNDDRSSVTKGK